MENVNSEVTCYLPAVLCHVKSEIDSVVFIYRQFDTTSRCFQVNIPLMTCPLQVHCIGRSHIQ